METDKEQLNKKHNMILPDYLIIVGIGLLVMLMSTILVQI